MTIKTANKPAAPVNYRKGRLRNVRLGVVHGTVSRPGPPGAANTAGYFAKDHGSPSSAHQTVDGGRTAWRSVADGDTAFAAPNANADGVHLELCMMPTHDAKAGAAFFASTVGQHTLEDGAEVMGAWASKYHLPARWLTPADVRAGHSGLCDHETITQAYNPGGHWDVGAGFPVAQWLKLVTAAAVGKTPPPVAPVHPVPAPGKPTFPGIMQIGSHGSGVVTLQKRLAARGWAIKVDGNYGPGTAAVVAAFQKQARMKVDGDTGPLTWAALWALPITK